MSWGQQITSACSVAVDRGCVLDFGSDGSLESGCHGAGSHLGVLADEGLCSLEGGLSRGRGVGVSLVRLQLLVIAELHVNRTLSELSNAGN